MIDELDKRIIARIQGDLPVVPQPFARIAQDLGIDEDQLLGRIRRLKKQGVIRRFGATLRHQEAGFSSNAMVAWRVPEDRIDEVGETLARFRQVTHCYHRPARADWPYNLYTMIHGSNREQCRETARQMSVAVEVMDYKLLFSEKEFKKTSMVYFPDDAPVASEDHQEFGENATMQQNSAALFKKAKDHIPGGVNSPVRACKAVGMDPLFIDRAEGCHLWDVEGRQYIDYVGSWGPMILGHCHPRIIEALEKALRRGTSYGAPTPLEVEMAAAIVEMVPSIEMVRMVNSGTEATMSAIRLARGYTGRDDLIKFTGCYHGHADSLLVEAGSGVATLGIPGSPGVPADMARHTLSLPFNDLDTVEAAFKTYGDQLAAVIVEPIPGNMGVVLPRDGFLQSLRRITLEYGALLIFDEVISGFRVAPGGAQALYGIMPDLTCLGKIIGGGLPVGAYGGRKEIMCSIAPEGRIYQAGTLSGNPLAMAAGVATLDELRRPGVYDQLEAIGAALFTGLAAAAKAAGVEAVINRAGSMGSLFFTGTPVTDFETASLSDRKQFVRYYRRMLEGGVYLAPSPFEASFVSLAHDPESLQKTIDCAFEALKGLA